MAVIYDFKKAAKKKGYKLNNNPVKVLIQQATLKARDELPKPKTHNSFFHFFLPTEYQNGRS